MDTETAAAFAQVNQNFAQVNESFAEIRQNFAQINEKFERIDQKFEGIDRKFEGIDQKFDKIDEKLERIDEKFEKVDRKLEEHDHRFDRLEQRYERTEHELSDLQVALVEEFRRNDRRFIEHRQQMEQHLEQRMSHYFGLMREDFDHRFGLLYELVAPARTEAQEQTLEQHSEQLLHHDARIGVLEKNA